MTDYWSCRQSDGTMGYFGDYADGYPFACQACQHTKDIPTCDYVHKHIDADASIKDCPEVDSNKCPHVQPPGTGDDDYVYGVNSKRGCLSNIKYDQDNYKNVVEYCEAVEECCQNKCLNKYPNKGVKYNQCIEGCESVRCRPYIPVPPDYGPSNGNGGGHDDNDDDDDTEEDKVLKTKGFFQKTIGKIVLILAIVIVAIVFIALCYIWLKAKSA